MTNENNFDLSSFGLGNIYEYLPDNPTDKEFNKLLAIIKFFVDNQSFKNFGALQVELAKMISDSNFKPELMNHLISWYFASDEQNVILVQTTLFHFFADQPLT